MMIHHLGPLVRRGEITISQHDQFEGWLQLFGQETLIHFELDSEKPSGMAGCRFLFQSDATYEPEIKDLPTVRSMQFGKLIALRLDNVEPPMFIQQHLASKIDDDHQCDFQFAWESEDEITNIAINPAHVKMHWADPALRKIENLPEALFPGPLRHSTNEPVEPIDNGDDCDQFLLSIKMPTESLFEDPANLQIQPIVHKVAQGTKNKMIDFMKEISEQDKNILICDLLEPPIQTPATADMSKSELQDKVVEILGRLSRLGIEFKRCEHFGNKMLYDWLVNKIIPFEKVHPELDQYPMIRFFDTSLWCAECGIYLPL